MGEKYSISRGSGRLIEGHANGIDGTKVATLLGMDIKLLQAHSKPLNSNLGINRRCSNPHIRAIAMAARGGLLTVKDLKMPGELFTFTMDPPPPESQFQYHDTWHQGKLEVWPKTPVRRFTMPGWADGRRAEVHISAVLRSVLSCAAWGMNAEETTARVDYDFGLSGLTPYMRRHYRRLQWANLSHAVGHAATIGIIDFRPEFLDPTKEPNPIMYAQDCAVRYEPDALPVLVR